MFIYRLCKCQKRTPKFLQILEILRAVSPWFCDLNRSMKPNKELMFLVWLNFGHFFVVGSTVGSSVSETNQWDQTPSRWRCPPNCIVQIWKVMATIFGEAFSNPSYGSGVSPSPWCSLGLACPHTFPFWLSQSGNFINIF